MAHAEGERLGVGDVVVEKVSEPVSSWMPIANRLASKGVTGMPRSAMMRTQQRDERPGRRAHEVLGRDEGRQLLVEGVVVEGDDLHVVALAERSELADAVRVHGVDEDEALDRVEVDVARIGDRHEVGVQGLELAHVAVDRAAEDETRLGIELARRRPSPRRRRSRCCCAWR